MCLLCSTIVIKGTSSGSVLSVVQELLNVYISGGSPFSSTVVIKVLICQVGESFFQ